MKKKRKYVKQEWRKNWKYLQGELPLTTGWVADGVSDDFTNKGVTEEIMKLLEKECYEWYQKGWEDGSNGIIFEKIEIETEVKFKDLKDVIEGKEDVEDFLFKLKNNN